MQGIVDGLKFHKMKIVGHLKRRLVMVYKGFSYSENVCI